MTYVKCGDHDCGLWFLLNARNIYCDVHEVDVDRTMQHHNELRQLASQTNPDGMKGWSMRVLLGMRVPNFLCCVDSLLVVCLPMSGQRDTNDKRGQSLATAMLNKLFCMSPGNVLFTRMTECLLPRC